MAVRQVFRPDSYIDLLFLGSSCMFMKWETENNFKKIEFCLKLLYFHANVCLFFLLFLFLSLSTFSNVSGKDPKNNKSIESGLSIIGFLSILTVSHVFSIIRFGNILRKRRWIICYLWIRLMPWLAEKPKYKESRYPLKYTKLGELGEQH